MPGNFGPRKATILLLLTTVLSACASSQPQTSKPSPSPSPSPSASPSPSTSAAALTAPGPLHFRVQTLASGLVAPWAVDFAPDGSIWLTERPGRVRVVRNGRLLPSPALSLSVVTQPGCEDGLLGLVVRQPYVYLYYTYSGSRGNTNRVSRFTIQGDRLTGQRVILDGIPGGSCYHFGGRIKFGPDGRLYVTTGEGFVASRAASPSNLSGKVLSVNADGSDLKVFAWGFRNPQGLAFDSKGRLYASNNGPTGDLGLCCHDSVYYVQQGHFYGWPAWAGNAETSYGMGGLPVRTPPIAESDSTVWAPSGMAFYTPNRQQLATLIVTELRGQALRRFVIDPNNPSKVTRQEIVLQGYGRLRDANAGPDSCLYVLTSNRDSRGSPGAADDRLLKLCA